MIISRMCVSSEEQKKYVIVYGGEEMDMGITGTKNI